MLAKTSLRSLATTGIILHITYSFYDLTLGPNGRSLGARVASQPQVPKFVSSFAVPFRFFSSVEISATASRPQVTPRGNNGATTLNRLSFLTSTRST